MSQQLPHNQKALLNDVNRNHLSLRQPDTRLPTVGYANDVLLKQAGTNNCQAADSKLTSLTELYLRGNQISDIKPLAGLTNLTELVLNLNKISDVKQLAELSNLEFLLLRENKISDVKPLSGLNNLTSLLFSENKISDVKSLSGLTNLDILYLDSNQISDIKPLSGLSNLTNLTLQSNPISVKVCPVKASACKFQSRIGGEPPNRYSKWLFVWLVFPATFNTNNLCCKAVNNEVDRDF